MADPFLGQIISVGFNFAPDGWLPCDGRIMPISGYDALYALIGTTYGGDGQTNFALPNLNGRVPLGVGQGQGLSLYLQGQAMGTESVTLISSNTPPHTHNVNFSTKDGTATSPKGAAPLAMGKKVTDKLVGFYAKEEANTSLRPESIAFNHPGAMPHENRQQFLVLNYIIATAGQFPPRS
jgi:microcystin-dependent protein